MNKRLLVLGMGLVLLTIIIVISYEVVTYINTPQPQISSASKTDAQSVDDATLLGRAKKALERDDTDSAIKDLQTLIIQYPDSHRAEEGYFLLGASYQKRGELLKAKKTYQKIVELFPGSSKVSQAQNELEDINIRVLFSTKITDGSFVYIVQEGDSLSAISKKFGTTIELISKSNGLRDTNIRIGQKLKITKEKFSVVVDKSQNILTLKSGNEVVKTYAVSTGKDSSTPMGSFTVTNRIIDPPWYPPSGGVIASGDPKNVLGSRWIGISKEGYGIHGTTEPESIGKSVTEGCVRMRNSDVEELYAILPEGTEVVIVD